MLHFSDPSINCVGQFGQCRKVIVGHGVLGFQRAAGVAELPGHAEIMDVVQAVSVAAEG